MDPQQQFCLKWNSYSSNLAMTFSNLFKSEILADVTLYCAGTVFKAHKLILAACSKNFAELFEAAPQSSSCVVILEATSAENMSALLEFMYKGEVHVSQEALNSFLKAAENLQIKGLSTEHGKLAATQTQTSQLDIGGNRKQQRCNVASTQSPPNINTNLKQECDSIMNPSSSSLGGFSPYINQMYRPLPFDSVRKRHLRSPFDQEIARHSVVQDGSKISTDRETINNKSYRPASSASSTAAAEGEGLAPERESPQSRYDNHSPPSTTATGTNRNESERDNDSKANISEGQGEEKTNNGAEDLRIKLDTEYSQPSSINPTTPSPAIGFIDSNKDNALAGGLASSIAPADMLNVWNATKLNSKGGTVNTADGKKLKCLYCDRLYGYETNLRAHIRQRHQGIRVPCPFCSRTFTRNNTVRRHIAREHKHEIAINQIQSGQPNNST